MANTYTLISSNVLSSSAASVTFSSIPGTYTDLVLRTSIRSTNVATQRSMWVKFNGTSANYSGTVLNGDGASATSWNWISSTLGIAAENINSGGSTTNSFTSYELYVPNYLVSQNKPTSGITAFEQNSTTAYLTAVAGLWSNTAAITSIAFSLTSGDFASGSSFYLYGIKNS